MDKIHWLCLVIGILLGWLVLPLVMNMFHPAPMNS